MSNLLVSLANGQILIHQLNLECLCEGTQPRMGMNPERTQPQMDSTLNGLNPE
jgi:hypothetical protein